MAVTATRIYFGRVVRRPSNHATASRTSCSTRGWISERGEPVSGQTPVTSRLMQPLRMMRARQLTPSGISVMETRQSAPSNVTRNCDMTTSPFASQHSTSAESFARRRRPVKASPKGSHKPEIAGGMAISRNVQPAGRGLCGSVADGAGLPAKRRDDCMSVTIVFWL